MGYAVAGIIVIIAGVLAWLSSKTWRWHNVTLLFLVVCAAATFGYLAAYTLKVHDKWRTLANKQIIDISKEEETKLKTIEGIRDENGKLTSGIRQLKRDVEDLIVRRGPAWFDVKAEAIKADGTSEVSFENPTPHGVPMQSVIFVFEADPISDGGVYLGEFKVIDGAGENGVRITPNLPLTKAQLDRLRKTKGLWTIYLKMPADENEVFAALDDEQAEAVLPAKLDEAHRKGTRETSAMSDWVYLFHEYALQRELLGDEMVKIQSNIDRLVESEKRNQDKIAYRTKEHEDLEFDKEGFAIEQTSVTKFADALEAKSKKLAAEAATVRAKNAKLAAELKALQIKAADLINQKTETAQAAP